MIQDGLREFEENIILEGVLYEDLVEESYQWYAIVNTCIQM